MVALNVERPDQRPVVCSARVTFHQALDALDRGARVDCGILLRRGIHEVLLAEAEYERCLPPGRKAFSSRALCKSLREGSNFLGDTHEWIRDSIVLAAKLTHGRYVREDIARCAISGLMMILDGSRRHLVEPPTADGGWL